MRAGSKHVGASAAQEKQGFLMKILSVNPAVLMGWRVERTVGDEATRVQGMYEYVQVRLYVRLLSKRGLGD